MIDRREKALRMQIFVMVITEYAYFSTLFFEAAKAGVGAHTVSYDVKRESFSR